MNTYLVSVMLQVKVDAFAESDANDAIKDCFGEGELCGVEVTDFEVLDHELLG